MFGWFNKKKSIRGIKEETKKGFDSVKKDINSIGEWINHLNLEQENNKQEIEEIKGYLSTISEDLEGLKNILSVMNDLKPKQLFKTAKTNSTKQTAVYAVQTGVQTGVQTPNLDNFSITERAILWILLNSDMKLSYDDLSAVLGKSRSTIRGQINTMQAKNEGLIEEITEKNGKKRMFIPEKLKEKLLKKAKVRVKNKKNGKKREKISKY